MCVPAQKDIPLLKHSDLKSTLIPQTVFASKAHIPHIPFQTSEIYTSRTLKNLMSCMFYDGVRTLTPKQYSHIIWPHLCSWTSKWPRPMQVWHKNIFCSVAIIRLIATDNLVTISHYYTFDGIENFSANEMTYLHSQVKHEGTASNLASLMSLDVLPQIWNASVQSPAIQHSCRGAGQNSLGQVQRILQFPL